MLRGGVPVHYRDAAGPQKSAHARVIDFDNNPWIANRFLAVRELKLTGVRDPGYNRRADLVCFVNGLPLVFIELKAVYKQHPRRLRRQPLRDYMDETRHRPCLSPQRVSDREQRRQRPLRLHHQPWEHFYEWKRLGEDDRAGSVEAEPAQRHARPRPLLDLVENFILFDESKAGPDAQGRRPQPPGARREPGRGIRRAAGRTQAARFPARASGCDSV
jgi:type I restriction enzyme R subunit